MKAIRYHTYGSPDVLTLQDVALPVVGDDDVLVRVRAASVNPLDWHFMRGVPQAMRVTAGLRRPRGHGLGADLAGHVEAVGRNVSRLKPGDEVSGCYDVTSTGIGTLAEYAAVSQELAVLRKPAGLTFGEAASVPMAALTALQGLRDKGRLRPGQRVLINGAAGGVGTFAVQLAKALGAEVTGVCSGGNVELVRSLGADEVIDYAKEDFVRDGRRYDVILDNAGSRSLAECRRVLAPTGIYLANSGSGRGWLGPLGRAVKVSVLSPFVRQTLLTFLVRSKQEDLAFVHELIEAGKVTPVIDRTYPLSEAAEAIRHLEEGHAKGKIVITL
jgi:NADPH:quinone reductase-like Zn-dependent oxidoreductase